MNFCVRRWCVRTPTRIPYLTYVNDEEWAFVAPYLTLIREDALRPRQPFGLRRKADATARAFLLFL
jgi:hypothetical protein